MNWNNKLADPNRVLELKRWAFISLVFLVLSLIPIIFFFQWFPFHVGLAILDLIIAFGSTFFLISSIASLAQQLSESSLGRDVSKLLGYSLFMILFVASIIAALSLVSNGNIFDHEINNPAMDSIINSRNSNKDIPPITPKHHKHTNVPSSQ